MVLRYLTGFRTQITVRRDLSGRINRIKSRLDQISENQKEYKIDHSPSGIWTSSTTVLAKCDDPAVIVGREEDVKYVRELLLHKEHPRQMFISILGESGVGKKTLTMEICRNEAVVGNFQVRVWYHVPLGTSMEDLLEEVYKRAYEYVGLQNKAPGEKGIDITDKLREVLTDKKYLVILGGISSKTILNCVRASLPDDKIGSRVMLILEPEYADVARYAATLNLQRNGIQSIHWLSPLDAKISGRLFRCRVDPNEDGNCNMNTELMKYKEYVFDVTQGHALAIVVLAGLLRYKEKSVEWDAVLHELRPGTEEAEDGQNNPIRGQVLLNEKQQEWSKALQQHKSTARETKLPNRMVMERIFSMSFDDLRQDIKSCFLNFAAYPNLTLSADHIVRMWTAEGFIKPHKGRTLEELGHSYLEELVSRCLIDLVKKNTRGGIELVMVHNRLLRFLQSEAREASFIEVHDRNDILAPASVRRLSIHNDNGTYTTSSNKFPKLRSFICHVAAGESPSSDESDENKKDRCKFHCGAKLARVAGGSNLMSHDLKFLCGSKFLRLISVQGLRLQELPDEIGDMIHLRYLRVKCPGLEKLPRRITRLLNLQTLDISKIAVKEIDAGFWKIKTLRHVLAEILNLPTSLEDELPDLQTLHGVVAGEGKWDKGKSPLDKLIKLQSLELHGFNGADHGSALEGALSNMHLLGHLKLEGDVIPSCLFTVPSLRCLQTIELDGAAKWPEVSWDVVHKVRPNLVGLNIKNISQVSEELMDKIEAHNLMLPFFSMNKPSLHVLPIDSEPHCK